MSNRAARSWPYPPDKDTFGSSSRWCPEVDGSSCRHADSAGYLAVHCLLTHPPRAAVPAPAAGPSRSEEHTSELQSLMRISYAVFCLKNIRHHETRSKTDYAHLCSTVTN